MLAKVYVDTKGSRNLTIMLAALAALLESKGFEVTSEAESDHLVISGDPNSLIPQDTNQMCEEAVNKPSSVLQLAHQIVHGDREQTYGDAGKNFRTIAAYWNTHILAAKSIDPRLTEEDVCGMMILLKQARLANTPSHRDSLVDIVGYTELNDIIQQQKAK